jgi:hypothetical protein
MSNHYGMGLSSMIPCAPRRFCIFAQELAQNTFVSLGAAVDPTGRQGSPLVSECPDNDARHSNIAQTHVFFMPYSQPYRRAVEPSFPSLGNENSPFRITTHKAAPPTPPSQNYDLPEAYGTDIRTDAHTTDLVTQKRQGGGGRGKVWQARES